MQERIHICFSCDKIYYIIIIIIIVNAYDDELDGGHILVLEICWGNIRVKTLSVIIWPNSLKCVVSSE